jgi:hypothetical protein
MSAASSACSAAPAPNGTRSLRASRQEAPPEGGTIVSGRPDLAAAGGAALTAAGLAIIHSLGLPEEWSRRRR